MSKYNLKRSIVISADLEKIKKTLIDFRAWRVWSPWLIMDRDSTINFSQQQGEVGSSYDWKGELVGTGSMELMEIDKKHIAIKTTLRKPFKSVVNSLFTFKELEDGVEVTWSSQGTLPFFMFFMKGKIQTFMGMDYDRGLNMLKEYIESGRVTSSIDISGVVTIEEQKYIGIENSCKIEDIGEVMKRDFETLDAFIKENKIFGDRIPFTIYNTFDMVKGKSKFISCMPIEQDLKVERSWKKGTLKSMEVISINHIGSYEHLGNGWTTAFTYARNKKLKTKRKPIGYEFYFTDPKRTDRSKLLTEICLPLE